MPATRIRLAALAVALAACASPACAMPPPSGALVEDTESISADELHFSSGRAPFQTSAAAARSAASARKRTPTGKAAAAAAVTGAAPARKKAKATPRRTLLKPNEAEARALVEQALHSNPRQFEINVDALCGGASALDRTTIDGIFKDVAQLACESPGSAPGASTSVLARDGVRVLAARLALADVRVCLGSKAAAEAVHAAVVDYWSAGDNRDSFGISLSKPGAPYTYDASEIQVISTWPRVINKNTETSLAALATQTDQGAPFPVSCTRMPHCTRHAPLHPTA